MARRESILVLGGTGRQGGAAARHLLHAGWQVRALVRDPGTAPALALQRAGAQLVRGDLDDGPSLRTAMAGVHGVFSVQTFMGPGGIEAEVRQGKSVAQTAAETNVGHLVYSSVGGADRDSAVPHFESKWEIERHIRDLGLPATILRPVFFMENLCAHGGPRLVDGTVVLRQALRPDRTLQMVAVDDIGAFAALAFDNPADFRGAQLELAGDELTGPQMAALFGELAGRSGTSATTWPPCTSSSTPTVTKPTSSTCQRGTRPAVPADLGHSGRVGIEPNRAVGYHVQLTRSAQRRQSWTWTSAAHGIGDRSDPRYRTRHRPGVRTRRRPGRHHLVER